MKKTTQNSKMTIQVLLLFVILNGRAQNLIRNGNFESYSKCPEYISEIIKVQGWYSGNEGTPDYHNTCSENDKINFRFATYKTKLKPKEGTGAVGLACDFNDEPKYEFIQTKLTKNLKIGKQYKLKVYLAWSPESNILYNSFVAFFSKNKSFFKSWNNYDSTFFADSQILSFDLDSVRDLNHEWQEVNLTFRAEKDLKYITLGFDKVTKSKKPHKIKRKNEQLNYYFIDDISLIELEDSVKNDAVKNTTTAQRNIEVPKKTDSLINKPMVLKNLSFETNKAVILPDGFNELNELVAYLKQNPGLKLDISGHTDNSGQEKNNLELSKERAKAVADYLVKNGIDGKRINYQGFGSTKPLKQEATENGKQLNRRVEIQLVK